MKGGPVAQGSRGRGSLDLNFDGVAPIDSRISFTRSTTATRTNAAGTVETSPINVPRLDYDPVTKQTGSAVVIDETTPANEIPKDHIAYAALHRETQQLIKKLQTDLAAHVQDESNAFHDVTEIQTRLGNGDERMGRIEDAIVANHLDAITSRKRMEGLLQENTDVTNEIREIIEGGKSFFKWVGRAASLGRKVILWVLPVVTAILSFWYVITGQHK